jgi:prepilin-type N-terminal cleavage/methylation domain-containing protein
MHDGMRTKIHRRTLGVIHIRGIGSDDGLTLIEVCVGMVVLSIAALGSAGLSDVALNMVTAARIQTHGDRAGGAEDGTTARAGMAIRRHGSAGADDRHCH